MKKISHLFLFSALTIVLLTAGCAGQQGSPTATVQAPSTATMTLTSTSTVETPSMTMTPNTTLTPGIPVTGWTASLVCQFCVDTAAHALLVMPAGATTTVLTPTASVSSAASVDIGCGTVETINDKQVVLCRAPSNISMILNVCVGNDCQQFMVKLQTCPPLPLATATVTPTFTPTPSATPTLTPTVGLASPTFTPTVSSPTFTSTIVSSPTATDTSTLTATATATP